MVKKRSKAEKWRCQKKGKKAETAGTAKTNKPEPANTEMRRKWAKQRMRVSGSGKIQQRSGHGEERQHIADGRALIEAKKGNE